MILRSCSMARRGAVRRRAVPRRAFGRSMAVEAGVSALGMRTIVFVLIASPVAAVASLGAIALWPERHSAPKANVVGSSARTIEFPRHVVDAGFSGRLELDREGRYRLSVLAPIDRPRPSIRLRMADHGMNDAPRSVVHDGADSWQALGTLSMEGRWTFVIGDGTREVEFPVSWRR